MKGNKHILLEFSFLILSSVQAAENNPVISIYPLVQPFCSHDNW
jgi:hypothetical protein